MPLPDVALKGRLDVDLNLLDVEIRAGNLVRRLDHKKITLTLVETPQAVPATLRPYEVEIEPYGALSIRYQRSGYPSKLSYRQCTRPRITDAAAGNSTNNPDHAGKRRCNTQHPRYHTSSSAITMDGLARRLDSRIL